MKKTFILLWLSHVFVDFSIGIWPIYKTLAGIDILQAGIIMGVTGFSGEVLQLAFGYFSDIGFRKKILLFGMLISSAALFLTFSNNFASLLALMLCVMIGSGSFHPAAVGLATSLPPSKGRSILLFASGGALGLGLSQVIFFKSLHWFGGHAYPLLIPFLIIALFWVFHSIPEQIPEKKNPPLREFFAPFALHKRSLLLLYASQVFSYGVLLSFIFLLPEILRSKGCSDWLFMGGGHMSFIFGSMLGMLLLGSLCDRLGYKKTLLIATISSIVLLNVFLFSPLPPGLFAIPFLGLLGIALNLMNPLIIAWGNHIIPQNPSTVSAFLMGLAWCFSNLIPTLAGFIATIFTTTPYIMAFSSITLFLIPTLFCILLMPQPEPLYN
ncbi:MAG: hypothetical protein KR126chlam3_00432 [Chlamydiae bacterium]|nr:hypothetical protein [Chlamydiota bacterium]